MTTTRSGSGTVITTLVVAALLIGGVDYVRRNASHDGSSGDTRPKTEQSDDRRQVTFSVTWERTHQLRIHPLISGIGEARLERGPSWSLTRSAFPGTIVSLTGSSPEKMDEKRCWIAVDGKTVAEFRTPADTNEDCFVEYVLPGGW